jgi:hypothetical protein
MRGVHELMCGSLAKKTTPSTQRNRVVQVLMGGSLIFKKGSKCYAPPTKSDGSPCCILYAWQPNSAGYYYDDCSMQCGPAPACDVIFLLSASCMRPMEQVQ